MAALRLTSVWTVAAALVVVVGGALAIYVTTRSSSSTDPSAQEPSQTPASGPAKDSGLGVLLDNAQVKITGSSRADHYGLYTGSLAALDSLDWCRSGDQPGATPRGVIAAGNYQFLLEIDAKTDVVVNVANVQVDITSRAATTAGAELVCGGGSKSNLLAPIDLDQPSPAVTWSSGEHHGVTCAGGTVCTIDLVFTAKQDLVTWTARAALTVDGTPVDVAIASHTLAGAARASGWYVQRGGSWVAGTGQAP